MTEAIEGVIMGAEEWTPQEAANHVTAAWQNAVASIVETGRRLIEAKRRVSHGGWLDAVELMPFGKTTASRLMQIAMHPDLANDAHVHHLPASWGTLATLAQLPPGEIPKRIEAGEITPELNRATAKAWADVYNVARQEALNAYSEAVDGLTRALSYAKTYDPPDDIPDGYLSITDFMRRIDELQEIATQRWLPF